MESSPVSSTSHEVQLGSHSAFFYGTLMARQVLYRVIYGTSNIREYPTLVARASQLTIQPALLRDHCRHRVRNADYPGVIPQDGESVRGTYVTGLTGTDMQRLDYFEGIEYSREEVRAVLLAAGEMDAGPDAKQVETETYIYTAGDARLEKGEWDFDNFVKNRMPGNWADDSSEEYEGLGGVATNEADTTGGRGVNTGMSQKLDDLEKS